ncbi:hypothetical protein VCHA34P116_10096 [Vibrio chagasii]|nr:hypothetical protein VCHA32P90_10096 [Vibrio chagasii]CAH6835742.1 hypothetical protein VCHA34P116_10096 [Vibrio chagasii]CAH6837538.1 hypothetical protein VCHA35O135_10003 [Vibrio chagasii]CAH6866159.1 hypothetical protein VCHA35O137_11031 [Vibrio chagasii]CAH7033765.1 hypothetical protein VCHA53O469_10097 [Vibrio chagasii]
MLQSHCTYTNQSKLKIQSKIVLVKIQKQRFLAKQLDKMSVKLVGEPEQGQLKKKSHLNL